MVRDDSENYFIELFLAFGLTLLLGVSIQNYLFVASKFEITRASLNVTRNANQSILFFNRVPKVGSTTIMTLLSKLQTVNGFRHYNSLKGTSDFIDGSMVYLENPERRLNTIQSIVQVDGVFVRHKNFLNFEEYNLTNPIYINFVRNPVERFISWYYFVRKSDRLMEFDSKTQMMQLKPDLNIRNLKINLDDCVKNRVIPDCLMIPGSKVYSTKYVTSSSQMSFFCGHDPVCDVLEGDANLKMAIRNVDKYYSVVGVLEDLHISLKVLENFVPRYFSGATEIYSNEMNQVKENSNIFKPKVDISVKYILSKNMTKEIEFYNFCRQRLYKQYLISK